MFFGIPMLALRRVLSALLALFGTLYKLVTCRFLRRSQNRIGELPFVVGPSATAQKLQQPNMAADWDGWNAEPSAATAVADQIEQYRRQKQEEAAAAAIRLKTNRRQLPQAQQIQKQQQSPGASLNQSSALRESDDLFSELQPTVKSPKKLLLRPKQGIRQRNLFAVQHAENGGFSSIEVNRLDELGDLLDFEQPPPTNGDSNWLDDEESIELSQIDAVEREQRRMERERRHKARLAEHATQLQQKRHLLLQHNHNNNNNNCNNKTNSTAVSSEQCRIEM